jgi:adenosylmethionine-8-amino-7-oxononanoate aminotransferase
VLRRQPFEPLLTQNTSHVSPCNAYRGKDDGESDADYVARLAAELDAEFHRVGPENVCAFIAEPVVGAVCLTNTPQAIQPADNPRPSVASPQSQATSAP